MSCLTASQRVYDNLSPDERFEELKKIHPGIQTLKLFDKEECVKLEGKVDKVREKALAGQYKRFTFDRAPLRNKYFFGEGYTYGNQLEQKGEGNERLFPKDAIDPIPNWIMKYVIKPLEDKKLIAKDWINSAVINDYLPGGCIVSHVDPLHIFDRPIVSISLFSDCALSFGCKFSFKPIRSSEPLLSVPLRRGCVCFMSGYAADHVTHCIRPEDVTERRVAIIIRRVYPEAPRLTHEQYERLCSKLDAKILPCGKNLSTNIKHFSFSDNHKRKRTEDEDESGNASCKKSKSS